MVGVGHRSSCSCLPLVRVEHEAGQGLGIEVGRLLGHHVAVARRPRGSRRPASAPAGTRRPRRRAPVAHERGGLGGRLRVADPLAARDGGGVDPGERAPASPRAARRPGARTRLAAGRRAAAERLAPRRRAATRPSRVTSPNRPSPPASSPAASNRPTQRVGRRPASTVEQPGEAAAEPREPVVAQAAHDAVGRQDGQLVGGVEEQHRAGSRTPGPARTSASCAARRGSGPRSRSGGGRRR